MNLQLTPRVAVHQQFTPDNAFTDMSSVNGQTHVTQHLPTLVDSVPEDDAIVNREAQGKAALAFTENQQSLAEGRFNFDHMIPSEQRLSVERAFTPLLRNLTEQHADACEKVSDFEDRSVSFKANICATYAFEGKHPDVKKIFCSGDHHFQAMLKAGQLDIPGYRMVEKRPMGGLSHQIIFLPVGVTSLQEYAQCDEAKTIAENEYSIALQKLIRERKAAAMTLTQAKQQAREALNKIVSFDELVSDSVKRSTLRK